MNTHDDDDPEPRQYAPPRHERGISAMVGTSINASEMGVAGVSIVNTAVTGPIDDVRTLKRLLYESVAREVALVARLDAMRPVVEAAVAYQIAESHADASRPWRALMDATAAYRASQEEQP